MSEEVTIDPKVSDAMEALDHLEAEMVAKFPRVECDVTHIFTPGLYIRTVYMPAGFRCTSKIHNTQHPFTVLKGRCIVFNALVPDSGGVEIKAPYFGITEPGTRRFLMVEEDTVWITYHPTDKTTVEEVEEDIIKPHHNRLLADKKEDAWPGST